MKYLLILTAIITASAFAGSAQTVTVTSEKVIYTRKKPIADFKKNFTIHFPRVKASSPAIARKIEAALSYEKVLGISIREEMGEIQWLEEADFTVDHNKNGILSVSLFMEGSGAYPSGRTVHVVIDATTGNRLTPATAFRNIPGLLAKIQQARKDEIANAIREIKADKENGDVDPEALFRDADEYHKVSLHEFSISDSGITFYHDYGFPHVVRALQPTGEFSYSWSDMKPYLKPGSLLARMVPIYLSHGE